MVSSGGSVSPSMHYGSISMPHVPAKRSRPLRPSLLLAAGATTITLLALIGTAAVVLRGDELSFGSGGVKELPSTKVSTKAEAHSAQHAALHASGHSTHHEDAGKHDSQPAKHSSPSAKHASHPAKHESHPAKHESHPAKHESHPAKHDSHPAKHDSHPAKAQESHASAGHGTNHSKSASTTHLAQAPSVEGSLRAELDREAEARRKGAMARARAMKLKDLKEQGSLAVAARSGAKEGVNTLEHALQAQLDGATKSARSRLYKRALANGLNVDAHRRETHSALSQTTQHVSVSKTEKIIRAETKLMEKANAAARAAHHGHHAAALPRLKDAHATKAPHQSKDVVSSRLSAFKHQLKVEEAKAAKRVAAHTADLKVAEEEGKYNSNQKSSVAKMPTKAELFKAIRAKLDARASREQKKMLHSAQA